METQKNNGTIVRLGSQFKNCEDDIGKLCPDWTENGMVE